MTTNTPVPANGPNPAPKPAGAAPQAAPVVAVVKREVDTSKLRASRSFADADFIPSRWNVQEEEDGSITASNTATGNTYSGSIANFNKALRGLIKFNEAGEKVE